MGWHMRSYQVPRTAALFVAGDWDDAVAEVAASTELAAETGENFGLTLNHSVLSLISYHLNDLGLASQAASAAIGRGPESSARYGAAQWALWARALILEATGETADALPDAGRLLGSLCPAGARAGIPRARGATWCASPWPTGIGGGRETWRPRSPGSRLTTSRFRCWPGAALRCQGLAEHDAEILQAAASAYAGGSRPLELARRRGNGTAFARQNMSGRARRLLDQAIEIYGRLDAARDVSRRTVQTHLAHVFAKLDITSRAQLAAEVARHREQPAQAQN